jgi:regulatory protein YycH of two-component signal transduction system YycFG
MVEIREYNRKQSARMAPEKYEEEIKKLRKAHDRLIKGRFEFVDAQGGWIEFAYRFFKGDMLIVYKLFHGEETELPAGLVKHINNTKKKVRKFSTTLDPNARGVPSTYEVQSRINFIPLESI